MSTLRAPRGTKDTTRDVYREFNKLAMYAPTTDGNGVWCAWMEVDAETATRWMATSIGNRNYKRKKLNALQRDLHQGHFHCNGDTIVFDNKVQLLDGHHRLEAVIRTEIPIVTAVVWGIDADHRFTIDTGATKSIADHLKMRGYKDHVGLGSTCSWLFNWHNETIGMGTGKLAPPSISEVMEMLDRHPDITESVKRVRVVKLLVPLSHAAFLHYLVRNDRAQSAEMFFDDLHTGENLTTDNPVLKLRNQMLEQHRQKGSRRMRPIQKCALLIKAWNYYREGRPIQNLRWKPFGRGAEPFPEIEGAMERSRF